MTHSQDKFFETFVEFGLLNKQYLNDKYVAELAEKFLKNDSFVRLPNFFNENSFRNLNDDVEALAAKAISRKFEMVEFASPRNLKTLGATKIGEGSNLLSSLYGDHQLRNFLEIVAGNKLFSCRHPLEYMVLNHMEKTGHTHGWHVDDPSYALIVFFKAPPVGSGGELELIKNYERFIRPGEHIDVVAVAEELGCIERHSFRAGDAYFFRADLHYHRVSPLVVSGVKRTALNIAFESVPITEYRETANKLYG